MKSLTLKDLIARWMAQGAKEFFGFSRRAGWIFFKMEDYAEDQQPARISNGYVEVDWHGRGYQRLGQIVHKKFGWS